LMSMARLYGLSFITTVKASVFQVKFQAIIVSVFQ